MDFFLSLHVLGEVEFSERKKPATHCFLPFHFNAFIFISLVLDVDSFMRNICKLQCWNNFTRFCPLATNMRTEFTKKGRFFLISSIFTLSCFVYFLPTLPEYKMDLRDIKKEQLMKKTTYLSQV